MQQRLSTYPYYSEVFTNPSTPPRQQFHFNKNTRTHKQNIFKAEERTFALFCSTPACIFWCMTTLRLRIGKKLYQGLYYPTCVLTRSLCLCRIVQKILLIHFLYLYLGKKELKVVFIGHWNQALKLTTDSQLSAELIKILNPWRRTGDHLEFIRMSSQMELERADCLKNMWRNCL